MPAHTQAWRVYMERLGIDCRDIEERMHGRRNDEIVIDFMGAGLPRDVVFAHGAAKEALFRELVGGQLRRQLVPGVIQFLRDHQGTPMALGTNAEPANVDFVLDGAELRPYFQAVVDGMQVARPKPFPDVYLLAAEKLNVNPRNCIVFEDSPTGIAAGNAAGARVVGVQTTSTQLENVNLSIRDFRDLRLEPWLQTLHSEN